MNAKLNSAGFVETVEKWNKDKILLRKEIIDFWNTSGDAFTHFWNTESSQIVRNAFVDASIQDINESAFSVVFLTLCDEFENLEGWYDQPNMLIELMVRLTSGKENFGKDFSEELNGLVGGEHAIKVCRSCLLLQFAANIFAIYLNQR
eukprot:TRINITY_DN8376_c0_g1_i2.p1 TRINITY_DN8376_c0_g1~~TRINITY_DN8376_c0_g1_i2.p1  ORF type:complete len:148 (+),score=25.10 TRINITY_DN8376_c0_g1_i2:19-462(+)